MIVINTTIIFGGSHAEPLPAVKNEPVVVPEKEVFPDLIFFASYLYQ